MLVVLFLDEKRGGLQDTWYNCFQELFKEGDVEFIGCRGELFKPHNNIKIDDDGYEYYESDVFFLQEYQYDVYNDCILYVMLLCFIE